MQKNVVLFLIIGAILLFIAVRPSNDPIPEMETKLGADPIITKQYFARVENGEIMQVIVGSSQIVNSGLLGNPSDWIEVDKGVVGRGFVYQPSIDSYIEPRPSAEAALDIAGKKWVLPTREEVIIDAPISATST